MVIYEYKWVLISLILVIKTGLVNFFVETKLSLSEAFFFITLNIHCDLCVQMSSYKFAIGY
jgi:hypothetical protein